MGVTYDQIKDVTDWQMSEESQQQALAEVVNAISQLDITQAWGGGQTSSSDGKRFELNRNVLQKTYSHRFRDYALEYYTFIADNDAPFTALPLNTPTALPLMRLTDYCTAKVTWLWKNASPIPMATPKSTLLPLLCWVGNLLPVSEA